MWQATTKLIEPKDELGVRDASTQFRSLTITVYRKFCEAISSNNSKMLRHLFWRCLLTCKYVGDFLKGPCKCILCYLMKTSVYLLIVRKTSTTEKSSQVRWAYITNGGESKPIGSPLRRYEVSRNLRVTYRFWGLLYTSLCIKGWQVCLNKKQQH